MTIELLVFDLDGTLVDSRKDILNAVNHTLSSLGLPQMPAEEIINHVGWGASNLVRSVLGEGHQHFFKKAMPLFKAFYAEHLLDNTVLYPGVRELIESVEFPKTVCTNKPTEFSVKILEGLGVAGFFTMISGGDRFAVKKPAPDALHALAQGAGVPLEKVLMIGDSVIDIEAGKNAGAKTCAVTYGFGQREDLARANPDYILDSITEVKGILKQRR